MNWFRLKTCIKCQGDLAADEGDWICLQCGTYYYTGVYQLPSHMNDSPPDPGAGTSGQPEQKPEQKMGAMAATQLFAAPQTAAMAASGTAAVSL